MNTQPTSQPADDAQAGTPNYGKSGNATSQPTEAAKAATAANSGHNDNPDEFSELRDSGDNKVNPALVDPRLQKGHVEQNQDPAIVQAAQGADEEVQRAAWAEDDPRYAGGGTNNAAFDEKADSAA